MKVGIVHGSGVNPDGSLPPHTKARANTAIKAYNASIVDMLIVCGMNEAPYIASYLSRNGIDEKRIIVENISYSTLSNLFYSRMLLSLLANLEFIEKVCPISNYWHIPRLDYDAKKILGKDFKVECLPASDSRKTEEIERDEVWERVKLVSDRMLLNLGYGGFNEELFLTAIYSFNPNGFPTKGLKFSINLAISPYQRELMKLEKKLYKTMKMF